MIRSFKPRLSQLAVLAGLFASSAAMASASCLPPPAGMVGWWTGDGTADDLVGNNPGSLLSGSGYGVGLVGQAFAFDGVASGVVVPEAGAQLDGFSALTIDAWIDPAAIDGLRGIVTKYDSRYPGLSYYLTVVDGIVRFVVFQNCGSGDGGNCPVATADSSVPLATVGQFAHVAGVWLGGNQFRLYWNGVPVASNTTSTDPAPSVAGNNATPLNIGRFESQSGSQSGPFGFFAGLIDEVEVFDRALSDSEVGAIYAAGPAGKCKTATLEVAIDIKPGSYPNSINLGASGAIPVAILSSASFDAPAQVNPDSLTLAGAKVRVVGKSGKFQCHASDVDGDGRADLLCQFDNLLSATVGDASAVLEGATFDGTALHGEDSIRIVPN